MKRFIRPQTADVGQLSVSVSIIKLKYNTLK